RALLVAEGENRDERRHREERAEGENGGPRPLGLRPRAHGAVRCETAAEDRHEERQRRGEQERRRKGGGQRAEERPAVEVGAGRKAALPAAIARASPAASPAVRPSRSSPVEKARKVNKAETSSATIDGKAVAVVRPRSAGSWNAKKRRW